MPEQKNQRSEQKTERGNIQGILFVRPMRLDPVVLLSYGMTLHLLRIQSCFDYYFHGFVVYCSDTILLHWLVEQGFGCSISQV
jgi:hypothetical protein